MDSGTLIIGIISIIGCVLPFVLLSRSKKKKEKQLLHLLTNIAERFNCKITRHEFYGELAIGLDESANFLFFLKDVKDMEAARHINLAEIQHCKIVNTGRTINNKEGSYQAIDRLDLSFVPFDKNKPNILLEFYNAEISLQLGGELRLIEKWEKIVNERLKG